jgi:hypothetical protein
MLAAALAMALASSSVAYTVDPGHRLIEGIATDGRQVYLSSPFDRAILVCRKTCEKWIDAGDANVVPMGLAWDSKRQQLWIALSCPKPIVPECPKGALNAVDRTGKLRTRLTGASGRFQAGDVSAMPNGDVFVGDSSSGAVYRLAKDGRSLRQIVADGQGESAQSTVSLPDGRIVTSDYSQGIGVIDPVTGKLTRALKAEGQPIRGIDGMVTANGRIFAIYNGQEPGALVEITFDGATVAYRSLFSDGGPIHDATQLAVQGRDLLVIVGSGWAGIDNPARRATGAKVLRVPIPSRKAGK